MNPSPMLTHSTFVRGTQRIASLLLSIVVLSAPCFAQRTSAADNEVKLVVALFRHGVRSPEPGFDQQKADQHSSFRWPDLSAWNVMRSTDCDCGDGWGYLTLHGRDLVRGLGKYYGAYYKRTWSPSFNVYLWADAENQRTRHTAKALLEGFREAGIGSSRVDSLSQCTPDLLFHPFQAGCGTPDPTKLSNISSRIEGNWGGWTNTYSTQFQELFRSLGCVAMDCNFGRDSESVKPWTGGTRPSSPISWTGRFSYASSATEAFLLEYANRMKAGWGTVNTDQISSMLTLHEFFFQETQRERYLAKVLGSNLVKEIYNVIHSKVSGRKVGCPHAPLGSQFVGLVGHDTNLANVGALLDLNWKFDDPALPKDMRGLPDNDALPAGALVFELRQRNGAWVVRVEYVTQSPLQMRDGPVSEPYRIRVVGRGCTLPGSNCEMSFDTFKDLVNQNVDADFLSTCDGNTQTCEPGGGTSDCKKPIQR